MRLGLTARILIVGGIVGVIVEAHGGTIDVTSQAGAGTRFRVKLPFEHDEAAG